MRDSNAVKGKRANVRDLSVSEVCLIVIAIFVVLGFLYGWG